MSRHQHHVAVPIHAGGVCGSHVAHNRGRIVKAPPPLLRKQHVHVKWAGMAAELGGTHTDGARTVLGTGPHAKACNVPGWYSAPAFGGRVLCVYVLYH